MRYPIPVLDLEAPGFTLPSCVASEELDPGFGMLSWADKMRRRGSSRERGSSDVDVRCFLGSFDGVLPAGRGREALLGSVSMMEEVVEGSEVVLEV